MKTTTIFSILLGLVFLWGCNKTDSRNAVSSPRVITSPSSISRSPSGTTVASSAPIQLQYLDFENGSVSSAAFDSEGNQLLVGSQVIWPDGDTIKNDILLAKLNPVGDELWMVRWGTENFEQAKNLLFDKSGGVYVAGLTKDPTDDNMDFLLLKYSDSGELLWEKAWGNTNTEMVKALAVDAEHNIFAAGVSIAKDRSLSGSNPVVKFSSTGEVLAGAGISMGTLTRVIDLTASGDSLYVAADFRVGESRTWHGLILGMGNDLTLQWGLSLVDEDGMTPMCIFETTSGDLLVVGIVFREDPTRTRNIFSVVVSKLGEVSSATEYQTAFDDQIKGAFQAADGTVYCYCRRSSGSGDTRDTDFLVVSFGNSVDDPTAYTLDAGEQPAMPIAMAENPSGGIELYTDDPFEPGAQWTETTLTGTELDCEITPAEVGVEALEIRTYAPNSTTKRLE